MFSKLKQLTATLLIFIMILIPATQSFALTDYNLNDSTSSLEDTDFSLLKIGNFDFKYVLEHSDIKDKLIDINDLKESYPDGEIVCIEDSEFGPVYHITNPSSNDRNSITFWDVTDFVMAGASWADFFNDPSFSSLGWAALDTAALLPLIPSSAYIRKGGKILIKPKAIKELAKTTKGRNAIRKALKEGSKRVSKEVLKEATENALKHYLSENANNRFSMYSSGFANPLRIRYTQDSINRYFNDGIPVEETIADLKSGKLKSYQLPPIYIFELDGNYYSLDNRRLYCCKRAGVNIKYRKADLRLINRKSDHFTTKDEGLTIRVRNR